MTRTSQGEPEQQTVLPSERKLKLNRWCESLEASSMNKIIYIIGLVVVVLAILAFLGLR